MANCLLLLGAGHENTTRLIGNGLFELLRNPEQLALLREDPARVGTAVDELLRYDGPVHWTFRIARETFHWRGQSIQKGQVMRIGLAAANRDPLQFASPDQLDVTRTVNRHLAFGNGAHFCLGAAMTRLEAQVVFGALLARFPRMRLEGLPVRCYDNIIFRDIQSLHVRLD